MNSSWSCNSGLDNRIVYGKDYSIAENVILPITENYIFILGGIQMELKKDE